MTPSKTDPPMHKLLVALIANAFALGSLPAMAAGSSMKSSTPVSTNTAPAVEIDMRPLVTLDVNQMQAARVKAKEHWAKMAPEEQSAAIKLARAKKPEELTALDEVSKRGFWARWLDLPWRIPPKPTGPATRQ
jgi:hypothetical protein